MSTAPSTVLQHPQVGVETAWGTTVPANLQIPVTATVTPKVKLSTYAPSGSKTVVAHTTDSLESEVKLSGVPTFDSWPIALAGIGNRVSTAEAAGMGAPAGAYTHVFHQASSAADTLDTFTLELGQSGSARRVSGLIGTSYSLTTKSESQVEFESGFSGTLPVTGVALTASPTVLPALPAEVISTQYYCDTSHDTIGTTPLSGVFEFVAKWDSLRKLYFTADATNAGGPAGHVETMPTKEVSLSAIATPANLAFFANIAAHPVYYVRRVVTGPLIAGGPTPYSYTEDLCLLVKDVNEVGGDEGGVLITKVDFSLIENGSIPGGALITVVNSRPGI